MEQGYYRNIRRTILIRMILVPIIPFVAVLGIGYHYFTTSLGRSVVAHMERIVEDHRQMITSFLDERKSDLQFIADSYSFDTVRRAGTLKRIFENLQRGSNAFVDLGVFNDTGVQVAYCGPYDLSGKEYGEAEWFRNLMERGYYTSDVFMGYRQVPHFIIAITAHTGSRPWVIRATVDNYVFNDLVKKVHIGTTGEAYIVNTAGILQTEKRSGGDLMQKDPDGIVSPADDRDIDSFIGADSRDETCLYATARMKDGTWLLVVRQEHADAFKAVRLATILIVVITCAGGVVIIGLAFLLTGRVIRRMRSMDADKERLNEQLIRAGRLAELGEMAAGFAHEINNPLQIITGEQALINELLSDMKTEGTLVPSGSLEELEDSCKQIRLQVNRCGEITRNILQFARKNENVSRDIDLREFIPDVAAMIAKKAAVHGVVLTLDIDDGVPMVRVDPTQLQQVLLNLFNNAIDAVLERHGTSGGTLQVGAGPEEHEIVCIRVEDNGCGIGRDSISKIFTPFYTTKPVGKGTGLGLSVCYGIVEGMDGTMEVDSEVGAGTTFTVRLPARQLEPSGA